MTATMNSMDQNGKAYSVLMSVYGKENSVWFKKAAESMLNQTAPPDEFVLICDGPLTEELETAVEELDRSYPGMFQILRLKENVGLGEALRQGILLCRNELVARMDSDDIACPDRCRQQLELFQKIPELSFSSGTIAEFFDERELESSETAALRLRTLPQSHEEIVSYAKKRNPMNHMAVMLKKSAVLQAGNYQSAEGLEDYDLWSRMLQLGFRAGNLKETLVWARIGNGMEQRRGGVKYAGRMARFQTLLLKRGFLSLPQYIINCCIRIPVSLLPGRIRAAVYGVCLRR
ncbi:MAG: glycosyltransferase [Clostridium sp.]|nr:glycosyltransferase [Clostridium sp.]